MILTDKEILEAMEKGYIGIAPFAMKHLGANSYDVHLSEHIAIYKDKTLDAKRDNKIVRGIIKPMGVVLKPNILYLCSTIEETTTLAHIPIIDGRSSVGRLGINIHATASTGNIGFKGHWTLEVTVAQPVRVYPGMPIGKILFMNSSGDCLRNYDERNSKYQNQDIMPQASKLFLNFKN